MFCFLTQIKEHKHFRDIFCLSKSQKTHKSTITVVQVVILHLNENTEEAAEERLCWQRRTRSLSKESSCAAWNKAEHPERGSGSSTLTAMSRLSEWRRTMEGQCFFRKLVQGRDLQWGFEGSFGLNRLCQPVGNHTTFVVISAINCIASLGAQCTEESSISPASLWPTPPCSLFAWLVGMHGWYPSLEEETSVIERGKLQTVCSG